ncbi:acylneuraminate cytidylyltransferase family protein [Parasphingorhabdus sp.]|uniref:acylneuraminate cytidylyltransferase family protein n=1 Tax=Parasphingorhabdus sp. TaxID=2709688 RepID=UPI00300169C8
MAQNFHTVALLPMKAHSERVQGKNFRQFAGKPLFRWVLDALLGVEEIDAVVINTDARGILADHGLHDGDAGGRIAIRDRKPEICGDLVSMNLVLADDIDAVVSENYVMTHTTNPLLRSATIARALAQYKRSKENRAADSLFSVNRVQTRFYRENGSAVNHDPDNLIRTQDLEPWFEENSNLYIFDRDGFAKTNARIGTKPVMFEMDTTESVDIDGQAQWDMAEAIALYQQDQHQ